MGHLDCCYVSALIDCLPKSSRVGRAVCFASLMDTISVHTLAGSEGDRDIKERNTDVMRGTDSRCINKSSSNPYKRDSGGGHEDKNNYGVNYIHGDETLLIR